MKEALEQPSAPSPDLQRVLRVFLGRRWRLLALVTGLALLLSVLRSGDGADAGSHEASLAAVLADRDLTVDAGSVVWLEEEGAGPFATRPALFLGHVPGGLDDLHYAEARLGDGGEVHDVAWVTNLTRTSSAAEQAPIALGRFLLYASRVHDRFDAITILDTAGEPESITEEWPRRARLQNAITNLQETGRSHGVGRRRYTLLVPAQRLSVEIAAGRYVVRADGGSLVLDPARPEPVEGGELVEHRPMVKGMPGTITWVVDTVRNVSWIGPEPIEWLEHRVFGVKDWAERTWYALVGADADGEAAEAAADMGVTEEERRERLELSVTDPELGWPPAALEPIIRPALDGEGEWNAVVDDPFVAAYANAPPAFYQTYLRPDAERGYARVYITIWDPRQIQLHIMAGTREPESATGETGRGMAPRDPETLRRLVAGFNGGFQALHGEFGMMSEGRVYLPPKPWASTVAVHRDGHVSMGSWTDPPEGVRAYEERWAVEQIPEDMVEMRQNLTSVVEGDQINPWGRWWWGAAPLDADEQSFIDRTGVCLTNEGFMAYFYGTSLGPEELGRTMLATRCARGMHLDMNSRHTGFEFYDVRPDDEPHPPLGRAIADGEHEGAVPFAEGFTVRARKMIRRMTPMRFPRYVGRDGRDFFYLTIKPTLPGPPVVEEGGEDGAGVFDTAGLPHAGWPHAFARAWLGGGPGTRTWLIRMDPRRVATPAFAPEGAERVLAWLTDAAPLARRDAPWGLWVEPQPIGQRFGVGAPPPGARIVIAGEPLPDSPEAGAALAVDRDGFLLYAEHQPGDPVSLSDRLGEARVGSALALPEGVRLAFAVGDQHMGPDAYARSVDHANSIPLLADERPATEILFPDTEPRPYARWRRMQDTRVRYFREGDPTFSQAGGGLRDDPPDAGTPAP